MGPFRKLFERTSANNAAGMSNSGDFRSDTPHRYTTADAQRSRQSQQDAPPSYDQVQDDAADHENYAPPTGPPPTHLQSSMYRQPHAGSNLTETYCQPPQGPPPGHHTDDPQYHDWQRAVPDTSLLPPPPAAANELSRTSNADSSQADAAREWCRKNPLFLARHPNPDQERLSQTSAVKLTCPRSLSIATLTELGPGAYSVLTRAGDGDICFATMAPLYFALGSDSPRQSSQAQTVYFEVRLDRVGKAEGYGNLPSLAIGFVAAPYPTWRMPGWERGSLAVHSDDGCRYVNNQDGGIDFVGPFKPGDVVGVGVTFEQQPAQKVMRKSLTGEAFFTRNGQKEGSWSLQEEIDAEDRLGNLGVEGDHDLFGAIGTFGEIGFQALFNPKAWAYRPQ